MPSATQGVADQLDSGGVNRRLAQLEREVRELRAAKRAEATTIGSGGLYVTASGGVYVTDDSGNLVLVLGALTQTLIGGAAQYGFILSRQNADGSAGKAAMTMWNSTGGMPQTLGLLDAQGNDLWTDDGVAGQGIGRPYLSFPVAPANTAAGQATNAGSWANLFFAAVPKQQPVIAMGGAATTPTGVTGQLRLWEAASGTQIGSTVTVAGAPGGVAWAIQGAVPGNHMDTLQIEVQGQITGGAGSITATVFTAYGRQS
jgi:hypothetical protein